MRTLDAGVSRRARHHTYAASAYRGLYERPTMCPHATIYVSSHYYTRPDPSATEHATHTCPDTTIHDQIPLNPTTAGFYVACMMAQIDVLRENGPVH